MAVDALAVYPWHEGAYQNLLTRLSSGFPHALLLTGAEGSGKSAFAQAVGGMLLCSAQRTRGACGTCRSCQLFRSGNHPDFRSVAPEAAERPVIKVDQVRELASELTLAGQQGNGRVAVIDPADRLNTQAANSLLKTLEEPPAGVVLLLVAAHPGRLPPTIRSRCQTLNLPVPAPDEGRSWLQANGRDDAVPVLGMAHGAPLRAIALADESVAEQSGELAADLAALCRGQGSAPALAAKWQGTGASRVVALVAHFMADILRAKAAAGPTAAAAAPESLIRLVAPLDWRVLYSYNDELVALRRALEQPLNDTLALERLFLGWRQALGGRPSQSR